MLWLCVAGKSSLPCACAPTFKRGRHEVATTPQDPSAVGWREHSVIQAPDGDVAPEVIDTVDDNAAFIVTQPESEINVQLPGKESAIRSGLGLMNSNGSPDVVERDRQKARKMDKFIKVIRRDVKAATGLVERKYEDRFDALPGKQIKTVSDEVLTLNEVILRFVMHVFIVWATMLTLLVLLMIGYMKAQGCLFKRDYIVNYV